MNQPVGQKVPLTRTLNERTTILTNVDSLEGTVSILEEKLDQLGARLSVVTCPAECAGQDTPEPPYDRSHLGARVERLVRRIAMLTGRVEFLQSNLDLP